MSEVQLYKTASNLKRIPNIKNIITVASAKGGVGKSTVTVNLAVALQSKGLKVGILDADIYGPTIPSLLGIDSNNIEKPIKENQFYPIEKYSISTMSIGYLVAKEEAAIWRGPIVSNTLMQLLNQTNWPKLDFLLIDLPPGTGDIQLTLAKKIPVVASIVVTTPQRVATEIAAKAITTFNKLNIPILGVVENMAPHVCSSCGNKEKLFSGNGGEALASQFNTKLLGSIPLDPSICSGGDAGIPVVIDQHHIDNNSSIRASYLNLAENCLKELSSFKTDKIITTDTTIVTDS